MILQVVMLIKEHF